MKASRLVANTAIELTALRAAAHSQRYTDSTHGNGNN